MPFSKQQALLNIDLLQAAYDLSDTGTCVLPVGFSPPTTIRLAARVACILRHDPMQVFGLKTISPQGQTVMAFRGTQDFPEWILDFSPLPLVDDVHFGFDQLFDAILPTMGTPNGALWLGHSLGGGPASQSYVKFRGELMTFGCPRVGGWHFADGLQGADRVENGGDIVPYVPLPPLFRHGGQVTKVHGPHSFWDKKVAHALTSYRAGVMALPDDTTGPKP